MNGGAGGHGANIPPRHFQQLAPGSPRRPRALNMPERGAGSKLVRDGCCSQSNAGRERKNQFPQTQRPFFSGCTQILSKGRRMAWLWSLYACLEGLAQRVEVAERKHGLHSEKPGNCRSFGPKLKCIKARGVEGFLTESWHGVVRNRASGQRGKVTKQGWHSFRIFACE